MTSPGRCATALPRPVRWSIARVLVAVILVALAGTSSGDDRTPSQPRSATQPTHIVTLGDSITNGQRPGVTAEQTFASLIESSLLIAGRPVRVTNVGIGGERTDQALARLGNVLRTYRWEHLYRACNAAAKAAAKAKPKPNPGPPARAGGAG